MKDVFSIEAVKSYIRRFVDTIVYGNYENTVKNVNTSFPLFFCKMKPNTSAVINLKISNPTFHGTATIVVSVCDRDDLSKMGISVLSTSVPAFFSTSKVYLATHVDGQASDWVFVGLSVPLTGTFDLKMQAVSSERSSVQATSYSVILTTIPHREFKVSDGYLAGYPVVKPIRELDAFRKWSPTYGYEGGDPTFFIGSAYFANPSSVPNVGESPLSAPGKWIQLARPDPGPMDISEGVKTPQLYYTPGLIVANTTALELRKAHQDQGIQYLSKNSKVYHFDGDLLDQDQANELNITVGAPNPDTPIIEPHFISELTLDEPPITSDVAITKKPFREVPQAYYGTYKVYMQIRNLSKEVSIDYRFKLAQTGKTTLFSLNLPSFKIGELVELRLANAEPFFNDNMGESPERSFPFNVNVTQPGTLVFNDRDERAGLSLLMKDFSSGLGKEINLEEDVPPPQPNVWYHLSIVIRESIFIIFKPSGGQVWIPLLRPYYKGAAFSLEINPGFKPIVLDELFFDNTAEISYDCFKELSVSSFGWAEHGWKDGWLTLYANDPAKVGTNLAAYFFPVGSIITQATTSGEYRDEETPWMKFTNFKATQFTLQGEVTPEGSSEKTRFWQRIS